MKYCFLFAYDSHFKSISGIVSFLLLSGKNTTVKQIRISCNTVRYSNEIQFIDYAELHSIVCRNDIIITSIAGKGLNKLIGMFPDNIIMALFPGVVQSHKLDDFISKVHADYLLLNSTKDLQVYTNLCNILGVRNNGIAFGSPWTLIDNKDPIEYDKSCFLYVEQSDIPSTLRDRERLLLLLNDICQRNQVGCVIKKRIGNNNYSPNSKTFDLEELSTKLKLNKNITFNNQEVSKLINKYQFVVSISSSACLEAVLLKRQVYLLKDFGVKRSLLEYFDESNLLCYANQINFQNHQYINQKWVSLNVRRPSELNKIFSNLVENKLNVKLKFSIWSGLLLSAQNPRRIIKVFKYYLNALRIVNPKETK